MNTEQVQEHYLEHKEEIEQRLEDFRSLRDASDERWFQELVFVILSSQTSAKKAWDAAEELETKNLLEKGNKKQIAKVLARNEIQYEQKKASYIVENREKLSQPTLTDPEKKLKLKDKVDPEELEKSREWLAENIKGISWKGASHFLRNIGYGNSFGIVSKHIITGLSKLSVVKNQEKPSNYEEYVEIEKKMQKLADKTSIDVQALDLVLWSMQTGEIFK